MRIAHREVEMADQKIQHAWCHLMSEKKKKEKTALMYVLRAQGHLM